MTPRTDKGSTRRSGPDQSRSPRSKSRAFRGSSASPSTSFHPRERLPKLFENCSAEDLRQALKHLRDSIPGTPFPPEDRAVVDGYREAIMRAVPKGSPVRVLLDRHNEESVMEIRTLPLTQVDKLIEALLSQYSAMSMMPAAAKKKEQARS